MSESVYQQDRLFNVQNIIESTLQDIINGKEPELIIKNLMEEGKVQAMNLARKEIHNKINQQLEKNEKEEVRNLTDSDFADRLIESSEVIALAVRKYVNKEMSEEDFINELRESGVAIIGVDFINAYGIDTDGLKKKYEEMKNLPYSAVSYAAFCEVYKILMAACEDAHISFVRRKEIEKRSKETVRLIRENRQRMEEIISAYFTERYEVINYSFEQMDQAILKGDSNGYIKANVEMQELLGYDVQFRNQDEFDDLMDSDLSFKL